MKTDLQLKEDVANELVCDPSIVAANVRVAVKDGVVTLTGCLGSYADKVEIERAAQRLRDITALAMELDVKLPPDKRRSDSEIAAATEAALKLHEVPSDRLQVRVKNGWITLKGEVDWAFQRDAVMQAVCRLTGVVGVTNNILLKTRVTSANIKLRIREALERHADNVAKNIEVGVSGEKATLRGTVHSWAEREAAQGAARSAPGVTSLSSELKVSGWF